MEFLSNEYSREIEDVSLDELKLLLSIPQFKRIIYHDVEYAKRRWSHLLNELTDKVGTEIHDFFPENATGRMKTMNKLLLDHPSLREIVLDEFFLVHLPFYESKSVISS